VSRALLDATLGNRADDGEIKLWSVHMNLLSSGSRTGGDDHMLGLAVAEAVVKAFVGAFVCFNQEAGHERESPLIEVALGLLKTDEGLAVIMVDQSQYRTGFVYAFV